MNNFLAVLFQVLTLAGITAWLLSHKLLLAWIIAVMIDQLPSPRKAYGFYAYFFGVVQLLAANLQRSKLGVQGNLRGGNGTNPQ